MEKFIVNIEIVGTCNLRCPSCPVGNYGDMRSTGSIGGKMSVQIFKEILNKIKTEFNDHKNIFIALYSWGEPLIHPDIDQLINSTKEAGFRVGVSSNLNYHKNIDKALLAEPDEFVVSLSGFSPSIYSQTHKGGDIEVVKKNLALMSKTIINKNLKTRILIHYHSYKHNTGDDVYQMAKLCENLKFEFIPSIAYFMPVEKMILLSQEKSLINDTEILNQLLVPISDQLRISKKNINIDQCDLIKNRLDIDADGQVKLCCASYDRTHNVANNFLDISFNDIQAKRNKAHLCVNCLKNGINRIYTLKDYDKWQTLANSTLKDLKSPLTFKITGPEIEGLESESALLNETIHTMNNGDLEKTQVLKFKLDQLINDKYDSNMKEINVATQKISEGKNRRGKDLPLDPLLYYFIEAVLFRNKYSNKLAARNQLIKIIALADLLIFDYNYQKNITDMKTVLNDWIKLPI